MRDTVVTILVLGLLSIGYYNLWYFIGGIYVKVKRNRHHTKDKG